MTSERKTRLAGINCWEEMMKLRDQQRELQKTAVQIVRGADLPQENNPQGLMRWYLHPAITDTVLSSMLIYQQELPPGSRSGMLQFQGGQVIYIIEGRGHTLIDGVKHAWTAEDVLNLPLRKDGITIQHVNDDPDKPAKLLAVEPNLLHCTGVDRGSGFEQLRESSDYKR